VKKNAEEEMSARKALAWFAKEHPLRYLYLEITRRCNLKCTYCGSSCGPRALPEEMPVERWCAVMEQIAADFDPSKIMLAITGGEPLLKPGVFDLFAKVRALGFPFGMVTNGTLINDETAKKLAACGIGSISISFDAPPNVNDALRGRGVAKKVERAVKALQGAGYRGKLEIMTTFTKPVTPHLDDLRKHIAGLKVGLWRIVPVMPIGEASKRPDLLPDGADIRALLAFVMDARKDGYKPAPELGEEGYLADPYEKAVRPYKFLCRAGLTIAGISYDGRIGACPELTGAFTQGHVDRDRFRDVWERKYGVFRDREWTRTGPCLGCASFKDCLGGSMHLYEKPGAVICRCLLGMINDDPARGRP
jgi:radical SAM protein with 4Fe4S-binding SPASM domain